MSVRFRIDEFEALSQRGSEKKARDDKSKDRNNEAVTRGKRFHLPGNSTVETDSLTTGNNFIITTTTTATSGPKNVELQHYNDFEADLQDVWSVRKNIHHTGGPNHIPTSSSSSAMHSSTQMKPALYSRHGAIPAQQTRGPQVQSVAKDPFTRGVSREDPTRNSLQDHNSKGIPWNVYKTSYSYNSQAPMDSVAKRPIGSPQVTEPPIVPAAKRRINLGGISVVRPTTELSKGPSFPLRGSTDVQNEKVSYAKKMAQGYLKSVGIGEFTPRTDMYSKEKNTSNSGKSTSNKSTSNNNSSTKWWKKSDDDQELELELEFEF